MAPSAPTESVLPQFLFAAVALPFCTLAPKFEAVLPLYVSAKSARERILMAEPANIAGHTDLQLFP